jgi:hypothetical protein
MATNMSVRLRSTPAGLGRNPFMWALALAVALFLVATVAFVVLLILDMIVVA